MAIPAPLRHAARSLGRAPVFSITASLTLVIGIAAVVAIFTIVNGVLLKPLPYGDPERLVGAWHDLPPVNITRANQTAATYRAYRKLSQSIEDIGIYNEGSVNVSDPRGGAEPQRITASRLTAGLIPLLRVSPLVGRTFTEAEDLPNGPKVVLISEGMWRGRFGGDRSVIGRMLEVNGESREIVGVMPDRFRFPVANTQMWVPLALDPAAPFPGGFSYNAIARLKPGVTREMLQREFVSLLPRVAEISPMMAPGITWGTLMEQAKPVPVITPLRDDVIGDIGRTLWMIAVAAGLVLLVACFNVANLILVRADGRQRELAVREALGAGRARVLGHFLAESALLASVAAVLGLALAWVSVRLLVAAGPTSIPRLAEVTIDWKAMLFTIIVALLVAIICSVIPALRIGRVLLANALREGGRSGTAGRAQHRVRGALVVAQIALALVVLAASGVLLRSHRALVSVKPGFDAAGVATLWLSPSGARYRGDTTIVQFYERLTERISALPGVRAVGITSRLPLLESGRNQSPFFAEGDASSADKIPPLQLFTTADSGYFQAMGIPLLAGRLFHATSRQSQLEVLISARTAEQFWGTPASAVGKRFRPLPSAPWFTVVGVVATVRDTGLGAQPTPAIYFPQVLPTDTLMSEVRRTMAVAVKTTGDPAAIIPAVQRVVRELDPSLPTFDARTMEGVVGQSMARLSFVMTILGAAAVVTLLLGAIGLYGVMAYLVTLRTRELGVRIALGAAPGKVATMMTRQGMILTAIGVASGLVLFVGLARFLQSFLYGVAATDAVTLAGATVVLGLIATLASWIPARRAARVDPAVSLRAE
ncbi:MAG TPA: ABC transporter permease [Gemmatimonadaceae bacterium]|nr:ABC transporter permease [Gemmatimonadaceae bacterium]